MTIDEEINEKKNKLTPDQRRLLEFVNDKRNWRHPTYGQIMRHFNFKSAGSVYKLLRAIKAKGHPIPFLED